MSGNRFDVLERFELLFEAPEPSFEGFLRRRERKLRNKRIAAGVVALAVFVAPIAVFAGLIYSDRNDARPATDGSVIEPSKEESRLPTLRYVSELSIVDLDTGKISPLPVRELGDSVSRYQFAPSPDGSQLAYVSLTEDGSHQIFVARVDGTGVRQQVTHDPVGAGFPAWSPDGTRIAYEGFGSGDVHSVFVLDVTTGESTQVIDEPPPCWNCSREPVFTPDGSSLIYTGGIASDQGVLRIVPVTGGKSALLFNPQAQGLGHAGGGSLSPDGSLLTFRGHEIGGPGALRFLANPDGTDWRIMPNCYDSYPAATWSPEGTRIVCMDSGEDDVKVVDIESGEASRVAEGRGAVWLDDHTLLVEA